MKLASKLMGTITALAAIFFFLLFIKRMGLPYTSEGVFFDQETGVTYKENAVITFGLISISLLVVSVFSWVYSFRKTLNSIPNLFGK